MVTKSEWNDDDEQQKGKQQKREMRQEEMKFHIKENIFSQAEQ
jgi:hypothetical protein